MAKVVLACLEPDPADRPLPHELAEGLEPALSPLPRPASPGSDAPLGTWLEA